jgi:hypothetical protein
MCEVAFGHEMICGEDSVDICTMDTDSDAHDHVLWSISDTTVDLEQIRSLESFKAEAKVEDVSIEIFDRRKDVQVVVEVAVVDDGGIKDLGVCLNNVIGLFGDHTGWFAILRID